MNDLLQDTKSYIIRDIKRNQDVNILSQGFTVPETQLTVGPVGPRGQNFRGSGKWRLCVRPYDRQTFLLFGAVKNQISVGPGYLLDP